MQIIYILERQYTLLFFPSWLTLLFNCSSISTTLRIGSSILRFADIMPIVHCITELCAVASLAKTIPEEIILIQDTLALFLKRTKLTFSDRPDELAVGMEVWCNTGYGGMAGIIRYIDTIQPENRLNTIGVELYHEHPNARFTHQPRDIVLKPDKVFQIFQSTVQFYNVAKRYGFLNHKNKTFFFSC